MSTTATQQTLSTNSIAARRRRAGSLSAPFAGRLGGNQEFTVDRSDPQNEELLKKVPDAAPNLTLRESFDLRGFREVELWKAALIEFVGTFIFVWASAWNSISPNTPPPLPSETSGPFSRSYFLGPLVASAINAILLALLIFSFGAVSGAHMNPLITIGTFFARLTTFPRLVLYLAAQISAGALAGLLLRAAANTREFKVGGCYLFEDMGTPVSSAFTIEVVGDLLLLVLAFGVGLDPRQREIFGPALGPIFVGLAAGTMALCTAFSLPAYGGAGLNAARCFGVFVGSRFPGWHWVHWVAPFVASIFHGIVYFLVPPGEPNRTNAHKIGRVTQKTEAQEEENGKEPV
ncbi:uncharacterized protein A1O5_02588 [Cladophialophora psammophila CBS 110553]|uniref:Aquaporin-like protein n=1 Tax=Cladophialophora psammophila CBS 110553 TaxID=1182543 RepID=W9X1E6_9EURO|nr:uncharacterized protein A1O5_02588 [Cladophialophora psammophila CBS 110553]EXJ74292.1 hypothetical protein A1O5_02588 [Cladophialophora psammophila CBS 110553]